MRYLLKIILFIIPVLASANLLGQNDKNIRTTPQQQEVNQAHSLAFDYYRNKEYDKAIVYFEKLYKQTGSDNYYAFLLNCMVELQQYDEAEKLIRKQQKKRPGYYKYYIDLGYVLTLQNKENKAQKQYDKVFDNLPPNQPLISQISNAFLYRRQTALAILTLEKGQGILGNDKIFKMDLANIYYSTGNYDLMISAYLDFLEYDYSAIPRIQNRLQMIINTGTGGEIRDALKTELLKRTQKNPDSRVFPEMLLWLSIQQKDFEFALIQAKAIDRRFDKTGIQVYQLAQLSLANFNYDVAIEAYGYIIKNAIDRSAFLIPSEIGILKAKFEKLVNTSSYTLKDIERIDRDYKHTFEKLGKNAATILLLRNQAHIKAFYLDELETASQILLDAIEIPGASREDIAICKLELADIYLFSDEVWDAILLYSQVDKDLKNDPIGHEARFRIARLYYFVGEFVWAKMKLDILKAATSKLIANDAMDLSLLISDNINMDSTTAELSIYARADLLSYQNKNDLALHILDSLMDFYAYHSIFDEALYKMADINIKLGNYQIADSLLNEVCYRYPFDILGDDALFRRAELNENFLDNSEKAMELYQQLLVDYPGSVLSIEARNRFRALRGDLIN